MITKNFVENSRFEFLMEQQFFDIVFVQLAFERTFS